MPRWCELSSDAELDAFVRTTGRNCSRTRSTAGSVKAGRIRFRLADGSGDAPAITERRRPETDGGCSDRSWCGHRGPNPGSGKDWSRVPHCARPRGCDHAARSRSCAGPRRGCGKGALMLRARVVGNVWATRRVDGIPSGAFLEVEVDGTGSRLVALDVLGCGVRASTFSSRPDRLRPRSSPASRRRWTPSSSVLSIRWHRTTEECRNGRSRNHN